MRLLPSSYAPKPPSEFQKGLLRRIQELTQERGEPPSIVEVATDRQNLARLRLKGWVSWRADMPRSLHVTKEGEAALAQSGEVSRG